MTLRFNTIMRALLAGNSTPSVPSFYFNFSNPSNVTLGAAQSRGNITSTQNAHITMSASLSRVVGVAPLYVNIDMTGTTSDLTANATHDLFYSVNWGDSGAGQWANGVQSPGLTDKNWSFGPVGGHVFETPGTYLVTPTSTDGVNSAAKPGYVTVLDPNVVYDPAYGAGYETICISNSNNFTGAPGTGALPGVATYINRSGDTDMYAALNTYKGSNKRILFCKADSWVSSSTVLMAGLTGTTVGGYGAGTAHTFASGTLVSIAPATGIGSMFQGGGSTDCRICNFKITGDGTNTGVSVSTADSVALTLYKIEVRGTSAGFSSTTGGSGASLCWQDQHCIYECLVDALYGYAGAPADTPRVTGASGAIGSPGIFTATGHKFNRFNKVRLFGTAPAGLSTGTDYYISATNLTANTFSLSAASFPDTPLAISGVGTCDVTAISLSGGVGAFVALKRGGFMGNYIDSCNHGEQTLRMPYLNTAHVNNNYLARPNQQKNTLKIHCRGYDDISPYSSGYSEKFVITSNVIDMRGSYSYGGAIPNNGQTTTVTAYPEMTIGSGGSSPGGERVRNVIVENNFTYAGLGSPKNSFSFAWIGCPNITVRNNIADFSVGDRTGTYSTPDIYTGMHFGIVTSSTTEQTIGVRIYNNTAYSNLANAQTADFVYFPKPGPTSPQVDGVIIQNNLWYYPFNTSSANAVKLATDAIPTNVVTANNTDSVSSAQTSPKFTATPPVALTDWKPTAGSYAIGTGAALPVMRDFNNVTRVGAGNHLGAVLP